MSKFTRRSFISAAAAASAAVTGGALVGAAPIASRVGTPIRAQGDKTEVVFYHIWGTPPGGTPAEKPSPMTQVIEAFNAQSTTTVIADQTPGNYNETLQKAQADIAAGNGPDLISTPWAFLNFAVEGLGIRNLADIAGDRMAELQGMIAESAWPLVDYNGDLKGLPWGLSTPIFYYNADVFEAAGVNPTEFFATWESFAAGAPALQEALNGNPVFALSYNKDWPAQTLIQSNGGRILNEDGTFGFASDEAKAAMQTIADLDAAGFYERGASAELRPSFVAGSTAILQSSVASLGGLRNDCAFNLGTSTWPTFGDKPRKASTGGSFLGVYSQDESKYAAITEFLAFCAGPVGYPLWNQMGYVNVSTQDVPRLEGQDPAYTQFEEGLERETNWPGARGLELQTIWNTYVERIWANDIGVEDGVNQAFEEITSIAG
ncbi:MAG: extracellular solute-binding protein [Thermomicrobiales bacterium]|nr:extracellular solute-binding protein [Thermomicrobiales bacterium]